MALVQTAMMSPIMLLALPAGAMADFYDHSFVPFGATGVSFIGAMLLTLATLVDRVTPITLLRFCFVIAGGGAIFSPSWQASIKEQVLPDPFAGAVGLSSIGCNAAHCLSPAVGGFIIAATESGAAVLATTLGFLPICWCFTRGKVDRGFRPRRQKP